MSTSSSNDQLPPRVAPFTPLGQNMPIAGNPGTGSAGSGGGSNPTNGPVVNMPGNVPVQMPGILSPASALEHYRLTQLYQYAMAAERLRCPPGSFMPQIPAGIRPELAPLFYGPYCRIDPRLAGLCRPPEEPKPQHSYIGLIAMAILQSPEKKLVLSDIYQYILDNFPYFRARGPGWRNSIRHNLSLNDCFVKAGRSANGKGHYWAIHSANVEDFTKGDFRRRRAQRKVRKHMGLAVDDDDSPSPPPSSPPPAWHHPHHPLHGAPHLGGPMNLTGSPQNPGLDIPATLFGLTAANLGQKSPSGHPDSLQSHLHSVNQSLILNRKRQFDVASLLAPEKDPSIRGALSPSSCKSDENERDHSLSSTSPPPTLIKRTNISKKPEDTSESEHSDNEDIEVTEDDTQKDEGPLGSQDTAQSPEDKDKDNNSSSDQPSPAKRSVRIPVGQDGTSSNEEDDGYCRNTSRTPNYSQARFYNGNLLHNNNPQNFAGSDAFSNHNQMGHHHNSFSQSNLPHGVISPLDFIQAQHFIQQHQNQTGGGSGQNHNPQNFSFGPGAPNILQQNPSLASLMILSSRYREFTSNMINASRRSPQ